MTGTIADGRPSPLSLCAAIWNTWLLFVNPEIVWLRVGSPPGMSVQYVQVSPPSALRRYVHLVVLAAPALQDRIA